MIGWKKAVLAKDTDKRVIVKLDVTGNVVGSMVGSHANPKFRTNQAKVLAVYRMTDKSFQKGHEDEQFRTLGKKFKKEDAKAVAMHDRYFQYNEGEEVSVDNWCNDPSMQCAPGIHFYMTLEGALDHC